MNLLYVFQTLMNVKLECGHALVMVYVRILTGPMIVPVRWDFMSPKKICV